MGAYKNAVGARSAMGALHRVILMEAVPAVDLDAFIHHVIQYLGAIDLDHRALSCKLFDRFHHDSRSVRLLPGETFEQRLDLAAHAIAHGLSGEDPNRHLGQFVLDHAELRDRGPERLALLGVFDRNAEDILRSSHGKWP